MDAGCCFVFLYAMGLSEVNRVLSPIPWIPLAPLGSRISAIRRTPLVATLYLPHSAGYNTISALLCWLQHYICLTLLVTTLYMPHSAGCNAMSASLFWLQHYNYLTLLVATHISASLCWIKHYIFLTLMVATLYLPHKGVCNTISASLCLLFSSLSITKPLAPAV